MRSTTKLTSSHSAIILRVLSRDCNKQNEIS